jgi:hypothetical protein
MIATHDFRHNGVEYPFNWAKDRYEKSPIPRSFYQRLRSFYSQILEGNIPNDLFNNPTILRCSTFRLKGLPSGSIKKISLSLINSGVVKVIRGNQKGNLSPSLALLPQQVEEVFVTFRRENLPDPGHTPILKRILIQNPNTLSTETPIWSTINEPTNSSQTTLSNFVQSSSKMQKSLFPIFTGHIDLIGFDEQDESLVIADYKPERQYLRSVPQVAVYGLFMKKILRIPRVKCVSFSREDAWIFDPEMLYHELPQLITSFGQLESDWWSVTEKLKEK